MPRTLVIASLAVHAALPPGLWLLFRFAPDALGPVLTAIHVGFPAVLLATWRRWWDLRSQLGLLLFANHTVTFGVAAAMAVAAQQW
ncbi:MAG: hypothetical protein H6737_21740 [Alphaproteobacteria bacterium]|nr:hypothetical protein [Alphaproteobacteria bacterium]